MYTNTVFSAALHVVPGSIIPISYPSSTTTPHVSISRGPSSDVYVVARKLFHFSHADHALRKETNYFYCD